jgi:hypothetical protein
MAAMAGGRKLTGSEPRFCVVLLSGDDAVLGRLEHFPTKLNHLTGMILPQG